MHLNYFTDHITFIKGVPKQVTFPVINAYDRSILSGFLSIVTIDSPAQAVNCTILDRQIAPKIASFEVTIEDDVLPGNYKLIPCVKMSDLRRLTLELDVTILDKEQNNG